MQDEIEAESTQKDIFEREIKHMKKTGTFISGAELVEIEGLSLFKSPITYIQMLVQSLIWGLQQVGILCVSYWYILVLLSAFVAGFVYAPGPHEPYKQIVTDLGYFAAYWVILGIASSVGLGTGLHTFVLYLGPHIATVTMAANKCGYVPTHLPSRWKYDHFEECTEFDGTPITFWEIYPAVFWEAFLWGAGTAIGELPPYFIARAAAPIFPGCDV